MARVVFRRAAVADLDAIAAYIAQDNPARALSFVAEIETACRVWAETPLAGRGRSEIAEGLRSFPFGNYVVFYRPRPDGLTVVHVVHGRRDHLPIFE
jgi:toxin ParE1/3/4